jgi:hypothetical protein
MAGNHLGDHSGPQTTTLTPDALDGAGIGGWAVEVGEGELPQPATHSLDPGTPGRVRNIEKPGKLR